MNSVINVEDYRKYEDKGQTKKRNDTEMIQAAIDAAIVVNSGKRVCGQVFIPCKTYTITKTIRIGDHDLGLHVNGLRIFGGGELVIDEKIPVAEEKKIGLQVFKISACSNLIIEGLNFDGSASEKKEPHPGQDNSGEPRVLYSPVDIRDSNNITVRHCTFQNVARACINVQRSKRVSISFSIFRDCYMDPLFSIDSHPNTNIPKKPDNKDVSIFCNVIERVRFAHIYRKKTPPRGYTAENYMMGNGIIMDADRLLVAYNTIDGVDRSGMKPCDAICKDQRIIGNVIRNCDFQGISLQGGLNIIVDMNIISSIDKSGILVSIGKNDPKKRENRRVVIRRNLIRDTCHQQVPKQDINRGGIQIGADAYGISVDSNLISNSKKHGIFLSSPENVTVKNNQIHDVKVYGIRLDAGSGGLGSREGSIGGNSIIKTGSSAIAIMDISDYIIIGPNFYKDIGNTNSKIFINDKTRTPKMKSWKYP